MNQSVSTLVDSADPVLVALAAGYVDIKARVDRVREDERRLVDAARRIAFFGGAK